MIHRMEGGSQFSEVVLSFPHACLHMSRHTYTHNMHIHEEDKNLKETHTQHLRQTTLPALFERPFPSLSHSAEDFDPWVTGKHSLEFPFQLAAIITLHCHFLKPTIPLFLWFGTECCMQFYFSFLLGTYNCSRIHRSCISLIRIYIAKI